MNMNQIINMIIRLFVRKAINTGMKKGIDMAARRGGKGKPAGEMSDADRAQTLEAKETAKRARKAAQMSRRLGKF